ncbi:MAG TPA: hypothetical protein VEZ14_00025 [Dehalococcoidia bacterium]|nr:hypothetical protein [Dehalococcoidia bacterium]
MEEFGGDKFPGTIELLQGGQMQELNEVFGLLVRFLEDMVTEADAEDEAEDEDAN